MPNWKGMAICLPWLLLGADTARAADACPALRAQTAAADPATRVAAVACSEHALWFRPFIDRAGRIASSTVAEAETRRLGDGQERAWQRVARYWQDAGLLRQALHLPGAQECMVPADSGPVAAACRSFVIDTAWSAAFVSWVMRRAALPGFRPSPSHIGYVREAYLRPETSAFRFADPRKTRPAVGDLLCYVRRSDRTYGHEGLQSVAASGEGLEMHCDVVVAVGPGNDSTAYLIGGNVQQGVTMRLLPLNRNGEFWGLPQRVTGEPACSPDDEAACNFNRQDWAVLLQLKPADELARLPGAMPPVDSAPRSDQQTCCVNCVVGSGVTRCPSPTESPGTP